MLYCPVWQSALSSTSLAEARSGGRTKVINIRILLEVFAPLILGWFGTYFFALDKAKTDFVGWGAIVPKSSVKDHNDTFQVLSDDNWLNFRRLVLASNMAALSTKLRRRLIPLFSLTIATTAVLIVVYIILRALCPKDMCINIHGLETSTLEHIIRLPTALFVCYYAYFLIWLRTRTGASAEFV